MTPRTLIIFDVDGTLLDAARADDTCFESAFKEVTGMTLDHGLWATFTEITGPAIIRQALGSDVPDLKAVEERVLSYFLAKLQEGEQSTPGFVSAFPGAIELIKGLQQSPDFTVAIATGCWRETAQFKLKTAGFEIAEIPFACASDRPQRAEIILLAAERAGLPIDQAVYVGDGTWDLQATRQLGIPLIGVGQETSELQAAGAEHILEELSIAALMRLLAKINLPALQDQAA